LAFIDLVLDVNNLLKYFKVFPATFIATATISRLDEASGPPESNFGVKQFANPRPNLPSSSS
jgi:hypothetical protein